ncbi:hypothetical protein C8F04DRAFT_1331610 [Mycena alexandri]|uniref:Uncharacterized protein n=1 Tax=Mycena alexandri TaxID=1745969 RepID=A0AAD6T172_9AGAR|nr:hypothetical protein C8F04DRAFT_1331610 [Mycena alexandri]
MDDEPHSKPEFATESSLDDRGPLPHAYTSTFLSKSKRFVVSGGNFTNVNEPGPIQPPGIALDQSVLNAVPPSKSYHTHRGHTTMSAFFPNSKDFVVTGGTFTNTNQVAPRTPSDFRMIPIGDLNLLKEIRRAGGSLIVRHRKGGASMKKMYITRIPGFQSTMTAAVFQGDGAEELYGIASAGGLHATVFHDDLIPHGEILEKYGGAHFSTVFFWARMDTQFYDVDQYVSSISGRYLNWVEYMVWIRPSTSQLCIELMAPVHDYLELSPIESGIGPSDVSLFQLPEDSELIPSISLQAYHNACYFHLAQLHYFPISTNVSVKLASIRHFTGAEYENSSEFAFMSECGIDDRSWSTEDHMIDQMWNRLNGDEEGTSILENGWIRVNSANVVDGYRRRVYADALSCEPWLVQANHIFNALGVRSNFHEYALVGSIQYHLWLLGPLESLPPGYLFLCPLTEIQTELPGHVLHHQKWEHLVMFGKIGPSM